MNDQSVPTTFDELEAIGWTIGAGASGYRRRYTTVGAYDVGAFSDGGGVYVERTDGAHHIDTADACALAARIAALISGDATQSSSRSPTMPEISTADLRDLHANLSDMHANLTAAGVAQYAAISNDISRLGARINVARAEILDLKRERDALREQANAAHAALDEAGAPACDGVLSGRITALATSLDTSKKERDTLRAALEEANATNLRLAGELAQTQAEREAAREEIAQAERVLTDAGVWHPGSITEQIGTLVADIKAARADRDALSARLAERPAPPDPRHPPVESDVEACWALLEEENPEARKWGSLNGALQNTLINLRAELRRAEGQLARAKAKAHTLLDEAIEGEDGA